MKRYVFVLICFFILASAASARNFNQSAEVLIDFNTRQGFDPSPFSISGIYDIHSRRFDAEAGLKAGTGDFQLTLQGSYRFLRKNKLTLGTGVIYNLNLFYEYSLSSNFLPGFYLTWKPCSFYSLNFDLDLFLKIRTVFALHEELPNLLNTTMAFRFRNDFYLPHNINLYFELSSIEKFRYMILCAPSIIFGGQYSTEYGIAIVAEAAIHYIDFFTLSANYEDTEFRLGVQYRW